MLESGSLAQLASACLTRFLKQNGKQSSFGNEVEAVASATEWVVARETAAVPMAARPAGELSTDDIEALVRMVAARCPSGVLPKDLLVPVRQLLKACLQRSPVRCRDSYREVAGGTCRRQVLDRTGGRISGAHCVDCPHWNELSADEHAGLLERSWVEGTADHFRNHRDVFLPEDFRSLRLMALEPGAKPAGEP